MSSKRLCICGHTFSQHSLASPFYCMVQHCRKCARGYLPEKIEAEETQDPGTPGLPRQRLSRPMLFMDVADLFGRRSSCPRASVGCVATLEGRIVASGYVGAPHGQPHCLEVGCEMENGHCVRTVHAEANLVAWSARVGTSLLGTTVWCTHSPCRSCALLMANAGVDTLCFWANNVYDSEVLAYTMSEGLIREVLAIDREEA